MKPKSKTRKYRLNPNTYKYVIEYIYHNGCVHTVFIKTQEEFELAIIDDVDEFRVIRYTTPNDYYTDTREPKWKDIKKL